MPPTQHGRPCEETSCLLTYQVEVGYRVPLLHRLMAISFTRPANIFGLLSNGSIDRGSTSRFNNRTQCGTSTTPHESANNLSNGAGRGRSESTLCGSCESRRPHTSWKSLVRTHGRGSAGSQNRPHTNTDEIWGHRICREPTRPKTTLEVSLTQRRLEVLCGGVLLLRSRPS